MTRNDQFEQFLQKYKVGDIDIDEQDLLFQMISSNDFDDLMEESINQSFVQKDTNEATLPPHIAEEVVRNIFKSEKATIQLLPTKRNIPLFIKRLAIAAVFLGIISLSYLFFELFSKNQPVFSQIIPVNTILKTNHNSFQDLVVLSDGSKVFLEPGSSLHFTKEFNGDKREVYLEGEAFFQVTKNTKKPFLVYYNNIVTKVLGTSFRISTNKKNGHLEVEVKTGRVQVLENSFFSKTKNTITPVIITPNQKAIYDIGHRIFETSLIEKPLPIITDNIKEIEVKQLLIFERQSLKSVFEQVEKFYQIEISVENANIYNCVFTGDISSLDLFQAIKSVCLATNASYELNGPKILIKGNGCN
jgi:hypothetical protein